MDGGRHGGHTVVAHGGQQRGEARGRDRAAEKASEGMTDRQTDRQTRMIRPLYNDENQWLSIIGQHYFLR